MNKKGRLGILMIILLLIIAVIGYTVSQIPNFDVEGFKGNLTWKYKNISVESQPELGKAIEYGINGLGGALFEIGKWGADFAAENPNISWKLIIYIIIFSLLAPIIFVLIKIIILAFILIKDLITSKKEKKEIKRLEHEKQKGGGE